MKYFLMILFLFSYALNAQVNLVGTGTGAGYNSISSFTNEQYYAMIDTSDRYTVKIYNIKDMSLAFTIRNIPKINVVDILPDINNNGSPELSYEYEDNGLSYYYIIDLGTSNTIYNFSGVGYLYYKIISNQLYAFVYSGRNSTGSFNTISVYTLGTTLSGNITSPKKPVTFNLAQNFPNPFNPSTTIEYSVQSTDNIQIKIFNSIGQLVKTLVDEVKTPGEYSVVWNGQDDGGLLVSSGVYFYQITTKDFISSKKMILLK